MAKDTWALLGVFAAGFLLLAGLMLGVYDRLDARIQSVDVNLRDEIRQVDAKLSGEIRQVDAKLSGAIRQVDAKLSGEIRQVDAKLSGEIRQVNAKLSGEIEKLQIGQRLIRERLVRLETAVGVAGLELPTLATDEAGASG